MPFSGFLASTGRFDFAVVCLVGALGNTFGSLAAYGLGYWGHERVVRKLVRRYGKYILFEEEELDKTEKFMHRYKGLTVLVARVVPGVRTIISLPAGIAELPILQFLGLTFVGSLIWSTFLTWVGFTLGNNWKSLEGYFREFEIVIVIIIVAALTFYIYKKLSKRKLAH